MSKKIDTLKKPASSVMRDTNIRIRGDTLRWMKVDIKLNRARHFRTDETGVSLMQQFHKSGIAGMEADPHPPDFNDDTTAIDFSNQLWQDSARGLEFGNDGHRMGLVISWSFTTMRAARSDRRTNAATAR